MPTLLNKALCIEKASYFVPNHFLDIENSSEWLGITSMEAKIYKRLMGLGTVPVANGFSNYELIRQALLKIPELESIKLIIYAHTSQVVNKFGNSNARDIRNEFNLNHALYFGTSLNNCSSIFNALEIADNLLSDMEDNAKALILVGDVTFTTGLRIVTRLSVAGDAAVALLVNKTNSSHRLISMDMACYGKYAKGLWLEHDEQIQLESEFMELFKKSIEKTLEKSGIKIQDVSLILPHNVNMKFWKNFSKLLSISPNCIFTDNIIKYAHCFGSDVIISWVDALNKNRIKKGDYYLMVTVGLGMTFSTALFQY